MVIYWLFAIGIAGQGTLVLVALVLAYAYLPESNTAERTHFVYQIRSFWLFVGYGVLATLLLWGLAWQFGLGSYVIGQMIGWHMLFAPGLSSVSLFGQGLPLTTLLVVFHPYVLLLLWALLRFIKGVRYLLRKEPIPRPKTLFI